MPRKIKSKKDTYKTHPVKDKRERDALMVYFLRKKDRAKSDKKYYQAYRNYILLLLGFNTAFRAEDLLQIRVEKLEKGYISIKEFKTGKIQNWRMNNNLYKELLNYFKKFNLTKYDYLFCNIPGNSKPITRQRADDILEEAALGIKLKQDFSMHSMRKTFAYHYYMDTGKLLTLQRMLNHSKPDTTLLYIEYDSTDVENERNNIYYSGVRRT